MLGSFCRWVKGSSLILNGISIEIEVEQCSFVIQPKKCKNCVKELGETIFLAIRSTNWREIDSATITTILSCIVLCFYVSFICDTFSVTSSF